MDSVEKRIIRRIRGKRKGWCFTPKAFLDLGSPEAVWLALHRLEKKGAIHRLARGLYYHPKQHPTIGTLLPSPEDVAKALSERDVARLLPSGAYAANLLGLSEQVPAKVVFLTDAAAQRVRIGQQEIVLKKTTPRNMATAGRMSGTVIQALRYVGKEQMGRQHIEILRRLLSRREKTQLDKDRMYAPGWMHRIIDAIVEDLDD